MEDRIASCDFTYQGKMIKKGTLLTPEMYSLGGAKIVFPEEIIKSSTEIATPVNDVVVPPQPPLNLVPSKKYTHAQLKAMHKQEQEALLISLGNKSTVKTEDERIKRILELTK